MFAPLSNFLECKRTSTAFEALRNGEVADVANTYGNNLFVCTSCPRWSKMRCRTRLSCVAWKPEHVYCKQSRNNARNPTTATDCNTQTRQQPGSSKNQPGINQESLRNQPGISQASTRHQAGIKQESNRNQPGIHQESIRNQTGIYQESTRHQPGINQPSTRKQAGRNQESTRNQ